MADGAYLGKYRGVVAGNRDPLRRLRIQVRVPDVLGDAAPWAEACLPYGYAALPPVGSGVWVEFEAGDVDRPVWTGTWWGDGAQPPEGEGTVELRAGETTLDVAPDGVAVSRWRAGAER